MTREPRNEEGTDARGMSETPVSPSGEERHPHQFAKFRRWPVKDRYRCVVCGLVTRHYDSVDGMGMRPIHEHMTVAVVGFNVVPNGGSLEGPEEA